MGIGVMDELERINFIRQGSFKLEAMFKPNFTVQLGAPDEQVFTTGFLIKYSEIAA